MRQRFMVIGAGGHAKVVIAAIEACGDEIVGVLDHDPARVGQSVLGHRVIGPVDAALIPADAVAVLAIGANATRRRLAHSLPVRYGTVVHPGAQLHHSVRVGDGSVVFAGAVIQPDTEIGEHVIINTSASIDHDNRIGAFAHIAPGAHLSGDVTVGEGALIGVGSAVVPGLTVGAWAIVGGGSAVVSNVSPAAVVGGCPARPLKKEP